MTDLVKQNEALIRAMHGRGWFPAYRDADEALASLDDSTFRHTLAEYRIWFNDEPTVKHATEQRFCKLPDRMTARGTICQFPDRNVTWHTAGALKGISATDFQDATSVAFGYWDDVCGVLPVYTPNPKTAHIHMVAANLGGPSGVLADSELPCGYTTNADRQIHQRYDAENWAIAENPPAGAIDLVRVICHELGHALGSDHIQSGNLLAPMYSQSIRRPQAGDIAEMTKRYGPSLPGPVAPPVTPPSVPPTMPPSATSLECWLNGQRVTRGKVQVETDEFRVSKLRR